MLRCLRRDLPQLDVFGLGGDRACEQGARLVAHVRDLAVVGLAEIVSSLPRLRRIFLRVLAEVDRARPDLAVLVDYSGFNLRLARQLKRRGIPIVYYVSPQVWAWRRGRIKTIRETVSRMLVLFPFEPPIYEEAGVPVTFVGHPLVDLARPAPDRSAFLAELGLAPDAPLIAVLPGSRSREIALNLPPLLGAVDQLRLARPDLQFALAVGPALDARAILQAVDGRRVRLVEGSTHALVAAADLALVASGTATVETALLGTPMVVVYRVSPLSYALGRHFVRVPHYSMVNLVAGRRVVTELIQGDFTAARVAAEALSLLDDPERAARMRADLAQVRELLGTPGASQRAAQAVREALAEACAG